MHLRELQLDKRGEIRLSDVFMLLLLYNRDVTKALRQRNESKGYVYVPEVAIKSQSDHDHRVNLALEYNTLVTSTKLEKQNKWRQPLPMR